VLPHGITGIRFFEPAKAALARRACLGMPVLAGHMSASPCADLLQNGEHRRAIFGNGIVDARWNHSFLVAANNPVLYQLMQVPDEHPLGDPGNTFSQLACALRTVQQSPEDCALPSAVDHRQHRINGARGEISFFDTAIVCLSLTDKFVSTLI
jgi:hypothetical protein